MEINIKKDYKFWLILIIAILVICLISFYKIKILNLEYIATYNPYANNEKYDKTYQATEQGNEIGQTFLSKYNNLSKIYIKFDTLKLENSYLITGGEAIVRLKKYRWKCYIRKKIKHSRPKK